MILLLLFIALILCKAILKSKKEKRKPENMRQAAAAAKLAEKENKRLQRIYKENQRKKAQEQKQREKAAQAIQDIPFYDIQLERLYTTVEDTRQQYKKFCDSVNHDLLMNSYGAVVKDKIVNQHITDRDKTLKKLITLENQIHALEKKKAQAETILARE